MKYIFYLLKTYVTFFNIRKVYKEKNQTKFFDTFNINYKQKKNTYLKSVLTNVSKRLKNIMSEEFARSVYLLKISERIKK